MAETYMWTAPCYRLDDGSSANCAIPGAELSLAQVTGR
jgi:hypothetical protein